MYREPLTVIVPCLNEEEVIELTIAEIYSELNRELDKFEILVVNDGSTDNTQNILKELIGRYKNLTVIDNDKNVGIWKSWMVGVRKSKYDCIAMFDADLQYQVEDILVLYKKHIEGHQFVQGVRAYSVENNFIRKFISKILSTWLKALFFKQAKNLKDIKSGFFVSRKNLLLDIFNFFPSYKYSQSFIAVYANFLNGNVFQIDTIFNRRLYGSSFLKNFPLKVILDVLVESIKVKYKLLNTNYFLLGLEHATKHIQKSNNFTFFEKFRMQLFFKTTILHKWFIYTKIGKYLECSLKFDKLSKNDIQIYQNKKLEDIIWYFYQNSQFFKNKCKKAEVHPYQIKSTNDLPLLPVLTKTEIKENFSQGLITETDNFNKIYPITTSGSTGVPLSIYVNKEQLKIRWANTFRAWTWTGWTPSKKQARLWHQTIGMNSIQVLKEFIDNLFFKRIFVPAYNISDRNIDRYLRKLIKHNPYLIDGYAESFNFLAEYLIKNKELQFSPKAIISSAQEISNPIKDLIFKVTGANIYDKYGSREFSGIAYEASGNSEHLVCDDSYLVELLKDKKQVQIGEMGEVFITDLNNYVTPMIRYQIGDLAEHSSLKTENSINFNTLGKIQGRTRAIIVCDDDKWVPGTFFAHFFKEYIGRINQYKVEQFQKNEIVLKIVLGNKDENIDDIINELRKTTGETKLDIKFVDSIPLVRTGKNMGAISHLNNDEILNNF